MGKGPKYPLLLITHCYQKKTFLYKSVYIEAIIVFQNESIAVIELTRKMRPSLSKKLFPLDLPSGFHDLKKSVPMTLIFSVLPCTF